AGQPAAAVGLPQTGSLGGLLQAETTLEAVAACLAPITGSQHRRDALHRVAQRMGKRNRAIVRGCVQKLFCPRPCQQQLPGLVGRAPLVAQNRNVTPYKLFGDRMNFAGLASKSFTGVAVSHYPPS